MKLLMPTWRFIARLGAWLFIQLRIYKYWSYLYRWLFESKYNDTKIPVYGSLREVVAVIKIMSYVADGAKQLWDAFSTPFAVFWRWFHGKPVGDCDDFAIFIVYCINRLKYKMYQAGVIGTAYVLNVTYMAANGKPGGHNVAVYSYIDSEGKPKWAYMDYGAPYTGFSEPPECAVHVVSRFAGPGATCLTWSRFKEDLTPVEVSWGI